MFPVSEITSGIQWALEQAGLYLVSFGPLNLILGMRYADASQDRFDPYSETTSMRHLPIGNTEKYKFLDDSDMTPR